MANTGVSGYRSYRNVALIVSEYGILFGPGTSFVTGDVAFPGQSEVCDETTRPSDGAKDGVCWFSLEFARNYMQATFNVLLTLTDANTGYAADGNRLVQAWSWYSLNDVLRHYTYQPDGLNGSLLDRVDGDYSVMWPPPQVTPNPTAAAVTLLGPTFRDYVHNQNGITNPTGASLYKDYFTLAIFPQSNPVLGISPASVVASPGAPGKVIFRLTIRNQGNIAANGAAINFYDLSVQPKQLLCRLENVSVDARCAADRQIRFECTLPANIAPGVNKRIGAIVSASGETGSIEDNVAYGVLTVTTSSTATPTPTLKPGATPSATPTPQSILNHAYLPALRR